MTSQTPIALSAATPDLGSICCFARVELQSRRSIEALWGCHRIRSGSELSICFRSSQIAAVLFSTSCVSRLPSFHLAVQEDQSIRQYLCAISRFTILASAKQRTRSCVIIPSLASPDTLASLRITHSGLGKTPRSRHAFASVVTAGLLEDEDIDSSVECLGLRKR